MKTIRIHNNINKIAFTNLSTTELNIIFYLFYLLQNKYSEEIKVEFKDIKESLEIKKISNKELANHLKDIMENFFDFKFINNKKFEDSDEDEIIEHIHLFNQFKINKTEKTLEISITKNALYLLNDLTKNFTKLNFLTYIAINGKYSKELYRRLVQFKNTNIYRVRLEEFRELFEVPKSYKASNIRNRIIEPSVEDLKTIFPNLEYNFIYNKNNAKAGRPKINTIEFTGFEHERPLFKNLPNDLDLNMRTYEKSKKLTEINKILDTVDEELKKELLMQLTNS